MDVIYIDESGHTGDLLNAGKGFNFSGQPHFVLGAIGPTREAVAAELLTRIAARHRLQLKEVKSDRLQTRPAFVRDLVAGLGEEHMPLFVEAVDKVFFLTISIVNAHVLPPVPGFSGGEQERWIRNVFADFLYQRLPDAVLQTFIEACRADTAKSVRTSLQQLLHWVRSEVGSDEEERAVIQAIEQSLCETIADFEETEATDPLAHRRFLPIPDAGKREAIYWMLPNYASLTNLYARVNRFQRGRLGHLTLVHDEQPQYDAILRDAKRAVEEHVNASSLVHPGADYCFGEVATLAFARSSESPGLMIADVVAGHVRRVLRDHMAGRAIPDDALEAFADLWRMSDPDRGTGVNLVVPTETVRRLQAVVLAKDSTRRQGWRGHQRQG